MIVAYGAVIVMFLVLYCMARRKGMGLSAYLYEAGRKKGMFSHKKIQENICLLWPDSGGRAEREGEWLRQFYVRKIRLAAGMLFAGTLFSVSLYLRDEVGGTLKDGKYLKRNAYGMGDAETELQAEIREENGDSDIQDFVVYVGEQQYEKNIVRQLGKQLAGSLPDLILAENPSLEEVRGNLDLIRNAEGYPFRIEWESDNYSCILSDGSVSNEKVGEEGEKVCLTAIMTYKDYAEEYNFPVHVFPPIYSEEEAFRKEVYNLLNQQEQKNRHEIQVELPEYVDGKKLIWSEKKENGSSFIFLLIVIGAGTVYFLGDKDLQNKMEARNRQMLLDYPQLVSRMTLYMGAGMTVRNVFRKIALDYEKEKQEGGTMHYVYEEMLFTCHELDSGVSESAAYSRFGKRCRMMQYMKFSNLLVQNLKKGSGGILEALRQEAGNAFEERKNMARRLGEEAGTKLLLPMMMMLGIVMMLIIIPAYFSFSV